MPFIDVKTNVAVSDEKKEQLKSALGLAITAIPGKSESWLMVGVEPEYNLWFKGNSAPAAMVQVQIFGGASDNALTTLTSHIYSRYFVRQGLCKLLEYGKLGMEWF